MTRLTRLFIYYIALLTASHAASDHTPPYKCLDALVLASLGKRHWTRVVFGRIYVLLLLFFVCVYLLLYMHGRRVYAGLRHGLSLGNRHEDGSWGDGDLDESRGLF